MAIRKLKPVTPGQRQRSVSAFDDITETFAPHVKEVRTMIVRGKRRRQMTRRGVNEGRTATFKKAIITLAPDSEQIDFFENI